MLYSEEKDYPYRQDGKLCRARLWETTLQSPYPAELAEAAARRQLEEELFPEEDEWLSAKLGITGRYRDSYEKMRVEMKQEPENPLFQGNVALAVQQRLKRNFRSGYWEAMIVHTKPLSVVPPDMRGAGMRNRTLKNKTTGAAGYAKPRLCYNTMTLHQGGAYQNQMEDFSHLNEPTRRSSPQVGGKYSC